jgi:hypothetical protein
MLKWLRRIILFWAIVIMGLVFAQLRGLIRLPLPPEWTDRTLFLIGLGAGMVALVLLVYGIWQTVRSWQLPEPEDPPQSGVILPKDLNKNETPITKPTTHQPPMTPSLPLAAKPNEVKRKIDVALKSVETAEEFVKQTNGRVKIELDVQDEDDE